MFLAPSALPLMATYEKYLVTYYLVNRLSQFKSQFIRGGV